MARLSAGGASEKDAMLEKKDDDGTASDAEKGSEQDVADKKSGSKKEEGSVKEGSAEKKESSDKEGSEEKETPKKRSKEGTEKKASKTKKPNQDTDKQHDKPDNAKNVKQPVDVAASPAKNPENKEPQKHAQLSNQHKVKKKKPKDYVVNIGKFFYHKGRICNRKPLSWRGIFLIEYANEDEPVFYGETTFIGGVPGLGFEPRKLSERKEQNVFKWKLKDNRTYTFYVRRLRRILYRYARKELLKSKFKIDCRHKIIPHADGSPVLHFCQTNVLSTDENYGLGGCALSKETRFGYDTASPCVMLRINKLYGYYPEALKSNNDTDNWLETKPYKICTSTENATKCCNDDRMLFNCNVMAEKTNVTIEQFPKYGYPYCFYPYNGQKGYMQPFIMIQLENLPKKTRIGIECTPTAPDLKERTLQLWFEVR